MKRLIFALFLAVFCATAFAQDYFADENGNNQSQWGTQQSQAKPQEFGVVKKAPRRNSFYVNAGIGFDMTNIYYNHRYYDERLKYDGTGFGYTGELTLGMLIKGLIAIHGSFEFVSVDGKYDLDDIDSKYIGLNDIDALVILFGGGVTAFPFSRTQNTFLQGLFVSAKMSIGAILMNNPFDNSGFYYDRNLNYYHAGKRTRDSHMVLGIDFEVGKDWQISERTYMGVGVRWQFLGIESGYDSSEDSNRKDYYHHTHCGNSLQVMLRINRK